MNSEHIGNGKLKLEPESIYLGLSPRNMLISCSPR